MESPGVPAATRAELAWAAATGIPLRSRNQQVIARSARGVAWLAAGGSGVAFAWALDQAWRGRRAAAVGGGVLGTFYLLMSGIALWRMRRACARARPVELFAGRACR